MEMCDSLMAETNATTPAAKEEAGQYMQTLYEKMVDFVMCICVNDCQLIILTKNKNLSTGARVHGKNL